MRIRHSLMISLVALATATSAIAAAKPAPAKKVEDITCHDFIAMQDQFKPQAVSYAIGYNKAKHPDVETVDVSGVERDVPVIISSCKERPAETLMQRIRALWNRL